ncbi:Cytochrome P450 [Roseomonas rosea]|uniref:Cytochrome P450 n=1 Tax=Muricoccus roseus TaxID=198092 RepID=A0A1M6B615_9PROT|nr:cytochrome P450 [Roseomonas rosea]SHI43913.1 Cytochrome P450 [Roseomonas rosea]
MTAPRTAAEASAMTPAALEIMPPAPPFWDEAQQAWIVTRYADLRAVLDAPGMLVAEPSPALCRVAARVGMEVGNLTAVLDGMLLTQNGAVHQASRAALRGFMPQLSGRWSAEAIDASAARLVAAMTPGEAVDMVPALAGPLPDAVIADGLGLSIPEVVALREAGRRVSDVWRPAPPLRDVARLEGVAAEARAALEAPRAPDRIPLDPAPACPVHDLEFFLISAAVETTAATLGNALEILSSDAELQAALRGGTALVARFVEEVLRFAGPVRRLNRRVAGEALELDGRRIEAGSALILWVESGHRDPVAYPDPDRFDLARRGPPLLAFGGGAHLCMGPALGRLLVRAAVHRLLGRFALAPSPEPIRMRPGRDLRQHLALPLSLTEHPA